MDKRKQIIESLDPRIAELEEDINQLVRCPYCKQDLIIFDYDRLKCVNPDCPKLRTYSLDLVSYSFAQGKLEGYKEGKYGQTS